MMAILVDLDSYDDKQSLQGQILGDRSSDSFLNRTGKMEVDREDSSARSQPLPFCAQDLWSLVTY